MGDRTLSVDSRVIAAGAAVTNGQTMLARMRLKMAVVLFVSGMCCDVVYILFFSRRPVSVWMAAVCSTDLKEVTHWVVGTLFWEARVLLWSLAPHNDDMQTMRVAMFIVSLRGLLW